jgi:YD repeat-containing protein
MRQALKGMDQKPRCIRGFWAQKLCQRWRSFQRCIDIAARAMDDASMTKIMLTLLTLAALASNATAQQTRIYGPDGRSVGTATTDSSGTVTNRDARGNVVSRESTSSDGVTTHYDARGRVIGRSTGRR